MGAETAMKRLLVLMAALGLCVGIATLFRYNKPPQAGSTASNAMESPATAAAPLPRQPTAYGINLFTPIYWSRERSFMNLAAGGAWRSIANGWNDMDPHRINQYATITSLLPGEQAALALTRPPGAYKADVAIRCRFEGKGMVNGVGIAGPRFSPGRLDFIWRQDIETAHFKIEATDPADPIRNIDCREADADPKAQFDPAFIASIRPYKVVRFMDWQAANLNAGGFWPARALPAASVQSGPQGVALEHMVALSNQAGVDPWFVLPWNADATYVENFARYVHDHLDPARTAYVEVGNEIWNRQFLASKQALAEGRQLKLSANDDEARMRRYAQRSVDAFRIWERIYGADRKRVVRVLSGQNAWPDLLRFALEYKDTAAHVDALSTALYFGQTLLEDPAVDTSDISTLFPKLNASIASTFEVARVTKRMADGRGLRFIAYEGGQHLTYRGKDGTLIARLNRDPRMGEAYRIFLARWDREFGDLLMLYHSTSPVGNSMHFGLAEYSGQPLSETPKRKAVLDAIAATKR